MRRLAVFALILALSAGLVAGTCVSLFHGQEAVEARETVYVGDRGEAEGLKLLYRCYIAGLCHWDASLTLGGGELAPEGNFDWDYGYSGLDHIWRQTFDMALWDPGFHSYDGQQSLTAYANDVARRTKPGQRRCEVIHPADYYEYWPWELQAYYGDGPFSYVLARGDQGAELAEIFQLRVPEGLMAEVWVNKNDAGEVTGVYSSVTDTWHEPVTDEPDNNISSYTVNRVYSALTPVPRGDANETGAWLYPMVLNEEGENVLEYRDGPGLYFIPAVTLEVWKNLSESRQMELDLHDLIPGRAKLLYPTEERPVYVRLCDSGEAVQLYTLVDGVLWLTVLGAQTGEVLDREEVMPMEGEKLQLTLFRDGLLLLMDYAGNATVLEDRGRECTPVFHTRLDKSLFPEGTEGANESLPSEDSNMDFAFDGTRLALVNGSTRMVLTANDAGITYLARLDFSPIWDGAPDDESFGYASAIRVFNNIPMEASFTGS